MANEYELICPSDASDMIADLIKKGTGGFTPRLKVAQGLSGCVTDGKARVGDLMLGDENLGRQVQVCILAVRPHALQYDLASNSVTAQSYVRKDPAFRKIQRDQKTWVKGASAGPEYLVWIPAAESFGTVHFVRGSLDNAIGMQKNFQKVATLTSELYPRNKPKAKRHWPVFLCLDSDDQTHTVAEEEDMVEAMDQFVAPLKEKKGEAAGRVR